jgi:hypothetical protein
MTTTHSTTAQAPTIRPVAIVYECPDKSRVTVSRASEFAVFSNYTCECKRFKMWGECDHTETVKAERAKQGRE